MKKVLLVISCIFILCIPQMKSYATQTETSLYDGLLAAGQDFTLALTRDGELFSYGRNLRGALGDGTTVNRETPVNITGQFDLNEGEQIIFIDAGGFHSGAITSEGRVFTWGENIWGQLGDLTTTDSATPIDITNQFNLNEHEKIIKLGLGYAFSVALSSEGRIFTWGDDWAHQLIYNYYLYGFLGQRNFPDEVTGYFELNTDEKIIDLAIGGRHGIVLTSDNRILSWGDNDDGECGVGFVSNYELFPVDITSQFSLSTSDRFDVIEAGFERTMVATTEGHVFTFGNNEFSGALGDGTEINSAIPIDISDSLSLGENETIVSMSTSRDQSSLVTSTGRIFTWGVAFLGSLGVPMSGYNISTPYEITPTISLETGEKVVYVSYGYYFGGLITSFGNVKMWGDNGYWQLGIDRAFWLETPTSNGLNLKELDVIPPTCDVTPTQTIEAGTYTDIDWTNVIQNVEDNSGGVVTLSEMTDSVLYDTVGVYEVSVALIDPDGNTHTETFDVEVEDTTPPTFDFIQNQTVEIDSEVIDWTTYITNPTDNATGILQLYVISDTIDYTKFGRYSVTVALMDESFNTTEQSFVVQVMIGSPFVQRRVITINDAEQRKYKEISNMIDVAMSNKHGMMLTSTGEVFTWGSNEYGQLGNGTENSSSVPINITEQFHLSDTDGIVMIASSEHQSAALSYLGRVFFWGANDDNVFLTDGVLVNRLPIDITAVLDLENDEKIVQLEMGEDVIVLRTSHGRLLLIGESHVELGEVLSFNESLAMNDDYIVDVSYNHMSGMILTHQQEVYTWGWNGWSQLGNGSTLEWSNGFVNMTSYIAIEEGEQITDITMGFLNGSIMTSNQRVLHWGLVPFNNTSSSVSKYETNTVVDITGDFPLVQNEEVIAIYSGESSTIYVTNIGNVFVLGDYMINGTEIVINRTEIIDVTSIINPSNAEIVDFDIAALNWAFLTKKGKLFTYGDNTHGQLGIDDQSSVPVDIKLDENEFVIDSVPFNDFMQVSLGYDHTLAVTSEGLLFAWGENTYGQLGTSEYNRVLRPLDVTNNFDLRTDEKFINVYAGVNFSFFVTSEYRIFAVGRNNAGQLGIGHFLDQFTPIDITARFSLYGNEHVIDISNIGNHTLLLTSSGRLFSWGYNGHGQLGIGHLNNTPVPQDITSRIKSTQTEVVVSVATGAYHSIAITSEGRVLSWGQNTFGQIGNGSTYNVLSPVNITSSFSLDIGDHIIDVAGGGWSSYALSQNGVLYTWGDNRSGQLGNGTTTNRSFPSPINGHFSLDNGEFISNITAGTRSVMISTSHGKIYAFGSNSSSELGFTSGLDYYSSPVDVTSVYLNATNSEIVQIVSKSSSTFLLTEEGRLFGFGGNLFGQLGQNTTTNVSNPSEIDYDVSSIFGIYYVDVEDRISVTDDEITISIYPHKNIGGMFESFIINGEIYTEFSVIDGVIYVDVTNLYEVGETIYMAVEGGELNTGENILFSGYYYTATKVAEDVSPPTFEFLNQTINIDELSHDFEDWTQYATNVEDNNGGEVILKVISVDINPKIPDEYFITIQAEDAYGNVSSQRATITLVDTRAPQLTSILAEETVEIMANIFIDYDWTKFVEGGFTENSDDPVRLVEYGYVDYSTPGEYEVIVEIIDSSENKTTVNINVIVNDYAVLEASLYPGVDTIYVGDVWEDAGVMIGQDEETTITVTGLEQLEEHVPGTYEIVYRISSMRIDDVLLTRYVTIIEREQVTVTFTLNAAISTLTIGTNYIDTGCSASDGVTTYSCDVESNNVDPDVIGTYLVVYDVVINGKTYTTTRYVFVVGKMMTPNMAIWKEEEVTI